MRMSFVVGGALAIVSVATQSARAAWTAPVVVSSDTDSAVITGMGVTGADGAALAARGR
jgi:hypothetical protein